MNSTWPPHMNQDLSKYFLDLKNQKIGVSKVKFYKLIDNYSFWKVHFETLTIDAIIRGDILHNQGDIHKEEIKFNIVGIQFRECWNYDIPPTYFQLIRFKN